MNDTWSNEDPRPHFLGPATLIVVMKGEDEFTTVIVAHIETDGLHLGQGGFRFRVHLEKWPEHWYWTQAP